MKKTLLAVVMSVIMIAIASCGGGNSVKHSDAYNAAEKVIKDAIEEVNNAADCDAVDGAQFTAVFGLLMVPDIENLPEEEMKDFEALSEEFTKACADKKAALACPDDWESDDIDEIDDSDLESLDE